MTATETSRNRAAPATQIWRAQTRAELLVTLRRGESVLLTFLIPIVILGFFSSVSVFPYGNGDAVDFLFPGTMALAVMSTAFVSTAIATGFERQMGVLKRLGSTPLTRGNLLAAKTTSIVLIEALQVVVLVVEGYLLGFRFDGSRLGLAFLAAALATVAFAGFGLLMAGTLPALTTLAAANGTYLLLLLLSGMLFPVDKLPGPLQVVSELLPSGALSEIFRGTLADGTVTGRAWIVLVAWAVAAPLAAARTFRWE
ncbi:MAG: ABC transporter permease [Acidimicrobiales bacterium]|nr:ABC transporter permease [Acidimicrobiales bacterium]